MARPDLPAYFLSGHAYSFCKRRVGELHFGQPFNGHPGAHGRGHHLYGLSRVVAQDVGSEDVVALPVCDQLAETVRPAVGHGPEQVVVARHPDGHIVATPKLGVAAARVPTTAHSAQLAGGHVQDAGVRPHVGQDNAELPEALQ